MDRGMPSRLPSSAHQELFWSLRSIEDRVFAYRMHLSKLSEL